MDNSNKKDQGPRFDGQGFIPPQTDCPDAATLAPEQPELQELFSLGVETGYMPAPRRAAEGELAAAGEMEDAAETALDISWRGIPSKTLGEPLPLGVLLRGEEVLPAGQLGEDTVPPSGSELTEHVSACGDKNFDLVLGVKFRQYGPVYFFRAGQEEVHSGSKVLVDTEQGISLAEVISARRLRFPLPKLRTEEGAEFEIKSIRSLAGKEDIAADAENKILASNARLFCRESIRERKLDMKLVDVEVLHDRSKIIFYFTAPSRIDFRDLVKDLVRNYRTRIELRQIGVRHETQMVGALGNCGMTCCCRRYLHKFAPVTIKMAKEQNLFLNPNKLSGICGRLLCCLAYEQENYDHFHKRCPKLGKKYNTVQGVLKVLRANLFRQSIIALNESNDELEFQLDDWHALQPKRQEQHQHSGGLEHGGSEHVAASERPSGDAHKQSARSSGSHSNSQFSRAQCVQPARNGPESVLTSEGAGPHEPATMMPLASNNADTPPDDAVSYGSSQAERFDLDSVQLLGGVYENGGETDVDALAGLEDDSIFGLSGSRRAKKGQQNNRQFKPVKKS